jgi:hypothetical protein
MVGKDIGGAVAASPGVFRASNVIVGSIYQPPLFPQVEDLVQKLCSLFSQLDKNAAFITE